MYENSFCNHQWKKESEVILPSAYEQIQDSPGYNNFEFDGMDGFKKKLVIVFVCEKCGGIHTVVETNP